MKNKVLYCYDTTDPRSIREVTFIRETGKDTALIRDDEKGYNVDVYKFELFPVEYKEELFKIVDTRRDFKRVYDESISLVYSLRNKITTNLLEGTKQ